VPSRLLGKAWGALCLATVLVFVTEAVDARWIVFSMSAVASVSLLYLSLFSSQAWLQRALRNRFLVYTGTISYGLYLLHKIPFNLGTALRLDQYPLVAAPTLLAVVYVMAALSWRLLERPFMDLNRFCAPRPADVRLTPLERVARS